MDGKHSNPKGSKVDSKGNVYIADYENNRIESSVTMDLIGLCSNSDMFRRTI
jgi:hypothetical protein